MKKKIKDSVYEYDNAIKIYDPSEFAYNIFPIPSDIAYENKNTIKLVEVFLVICVYKNMLNETDLSIYDIIEFLGYPSNYSTISQSTTPQKMVEAIEKLKEMGYIGCELDKVTYKKKIHIRFNAKLHYERTITNKHRYVLLYGDELLKIIEYNRNRKKGENKPTLSKVLICLLFIRDYIPRRPSQMITMYTDSIDDYKKNYPECYNSSFDSLSEDLPFTRQTVSRCCKELEDLEILHTERFNKNVRYTVRNRVYDKKVVTTLFTNYKKREKEKVYAIGEDYYKTEVNNKIDIILKAVMKNREI